MKSERGIGQRAKTYCSPEMWAQRVKCNCFFFPSLPPVLAKWDVKRAFKYLQIFQSRFCLTCHSLRGISDVETSLAGCVTCRKSFHQPYETYLSGFVGFKQKTSPGQLEEQEMNWKIKLIKFGMRLPGLEVCLWFIAFLTTSNGRGETQRALLPERSPAGATWLQRRHLRCLPPSRSMRLKETTGDELLAKAPGNHVTSIKPNWRILLSLFHLYMVTKQGWMTVRWLWSKWIYLFK